ncbi:MAG: putative addiction module antidote protein [Rickettsiales bacterium]|jgi:probable addiction module antidote protein|nr:putative addiction module antidote protein [Rickettsiales bacterium]
MDKIRLKKWDVTEHLDNEEIIAAYLADAFENGNGEEIKQALADVAKAKNMTEIANNMGISRQGLYKMLSEKGNPEFKTVKSMLDALGVKFSIIPKSENRISK